MFCIECSAITENIDRVQNSTLEERVELLEIQVVVIQDEVSDLELDVNFLFDEQIIQDERLLNLEENSNILNEEVEGELRMNGKYDKAVFCKSTPRKLINVYISQREFDTTHEAK